MHRVWICLCLLLCQCCSYRKDGIVFSKDPIRYPSPNKLYKRDSLYLSYTIQQFSALGVIGYGYEIHRIDIDTIVYSPDSLKLFAFVIDYAKADNELSYDGHAILGYRLKTTDSWIVYPFHRYAIFVGYDNYNTIRDKLRKAYFQYLKGYSLYFWNCQHKRFEDYDFKYNLINPKFWDSCIIWKKDVSILGYYQFQLSGNGDPDMPHNILKIPEIHYPDSLWR